METKTINKYTSAPFLIALLILPSIISLEAILSFYWPTPIILVFLGISVYHSIIPVAVVVLAIKTDTHNPGDTSISSLSQLPKHSKKQPKQVNILAFQLCVLISDISYTHHFLLNPFFVKCPFHLSHILPLTTVFAAFIPLSSYTPNHSPIFFYTTTTKQLV